MRNTNSEPMFPNGSIRISGGEPRLTRESDYIGVVVGAFDCVVYGEFLGGVGHVHVVIERGC